MKSLFKILVCIFFLILQGITSCCYADFDSDVLVISDRIVHPYVLENKDSIVSEYLQLMGDDGEFIDLDYDSHEMSDWDPQYHNERCFYLACAYINPNSFFYESDNLYNSIINALDFYDKKNPWSNNWYKAVIREPKMWGLILLAMEQGKRKIPEELKNNYLRKMEDNTLDPSVKTGANRTEIATHFLYRGLLKKNQDLINYSLQFLFESMAYTNDASLQVDNSFLQHGAQLYIGGYGYVYITDLLNLLSWVRGTQFIPSDEQIKVLSGFIRSTFQNVIRGRYISYNCVGRPIARQGFLDMSSLAPSLEIMKEIDYENAPEYDAFIRRLSTIPTETDYGVKSCHYHLWRGDYTIHVRPDYTITLRTVSNRTIRNESISQENIYGYYLSDGSICIAQTGDEYYDNPLAELI